MKWKCLLFSVCLWGLSSLSSFAAPVKNVIWVIGDGMGPEIIGFFMQGTRYANLPGMEKTSHTEALLNQAVWGLFFNNTFDTVVTDSAAAATQMATGQWSRPLFVGMDAQEKPAPTLLEMAREHGKAVGIITDTYVTDATPAAFTAHTKSRREKYEIARQQIAFAPEVILGGGLTYFNEGENKHLLRQAKKQGYQVVQTKKQLARVKRGPVLGLFAPQALPMDVERYKYPHIPTLVQMTQQALKVLEQDSDGFVLMVEAGKIDWAAHAHDGGALWAEMKEFDELMGYLTDYLAHHPDTLLYVNADHDTGMGGFAYRHVSKEQAATKTAQGEVLYDKNTDYGSFNTYALFEKQKRSLYLLYEELKALPEKQRTRTEIQKRLTQALGYEVDFSDVKEDASLEEIFKQINTQRAIAFATQNHSAAPLISIAYGSGAQAFGGVYHNTQILPRMKQILGW